jgi:hypothetical protein
MSLILHPTRRYERAFMHQFDDTWDVEHGITKGRFEYVRAGDADGAAACVRDGRIRLLELIRGHIDDPLVAPYLAPAAEVRPRRSTRNRRTSTGADTSSRPNDSVAG